MRSLAALALVLLSLGPAALAAAVPECYVRVLQPITDDLGNHWQTGQILPVTIARDKRQGGAFCASGGSCLPRAVNGSPALVLTNCRVGPSIGNGDSRLVPDPTLAGPALAHAMRTRDNVDSNLVALGFSNAAAGTLADQYLKAPHSRTGRLVAQALAGSNAAVATLKRRIP